MYLNPNIISWIFTKPCFIFDQKKFVPEPRPHFLDFCQNLFYIIEQKYFLLTRHHEAWSGQTYCQKSSRWRAAFWNRNNLFGNLKQELFMWKSKKEIFHCSNQLWKLKAKCKELGLGPKLEMKIKRARNMWLYDYVCQSELSLWTAWRAVAFWRRGRNNDCKLIFLQTYLDQNFLKWFSS